MTEQSKTGAIDRLIAGLRDHGLATISDPDVAVDVALKMLVDGRTYANALKDRPTHAQHESTTKLTSIYEGQLRTLSEFLSKRYSHVDKPVGESPADTAVRLLTPDKVGMNMTIHVGPGQTGEDIAAEIRDALRTYMRQRAGGETASTKVVPPEHVNAAADATKVVGAAQAGTTQPHGRAVDHEPNVYLSQRAYAYFFDLAWT